MKKHKGIQKIAISAMLISLSTVIGIVCKNLFSIGLFYRITFENLPIIFASLTLGPLYGAVIGFASDFISCICSVNPAVNPLISIGAISVGLFSGISARVFKNKTINKRVALSAIAGHLIGQVMIKSIAKIIYFGMPWWGLGISFLSSAVVCTFEILIIKLLMNNRSVTGYMEKLK